jgi:hypothetical protein
MIQRISLSKRALFRTALGLALIAPAVHAQPATVQFATGVTGAFGAVVLNGSGINPATGNFFRYLWTADPTNGVCRLDPDIDTPGVHGINSATCLTTAAGAAINAGQLSFDATTNNIYAVDLSGKSNGILRLHFVPSGDSGHGLISKVQLEVVGSGCNIGLNQPTAAALGPDGNLYVGFKRVNNVMRILVPQTEPLPCSNVQATVIAAGGSVSGIGWVGHDIFIANKTLTGVATNGDTCFTPVNGMNPCTLGVFLPALGTGVVTSDQPFPSATGKDVFVGEISASRNSVRQRTRLRRIMGEPLSPTSAAWPWTPETRRARWYMSGMIRAPVSVRRAAAGSRSALRRLRPRPPARRST